MITRKADVIAALEARDFGRLCSLQEAGGGVFRILRGLACDVEEPIFWVACEAVGPLSRFLARHGGPDPVRNMVRRLIWSLSDESGDMAWNAPEMLTSIFLYNPDLCEDVARILVHLDEAIFRKSAALAAARIAPARPDIVGEVKEELIGELASDDPETRAYAAWALGNLGDEGAAPGISGLLSDDSGPVKVYRDGRLSRVTVRDLAEESIRRLTKR